MRMTAKRRAEEAAAASAVIAPTRQVPRRQLEATVRTCLANAERFEAAGYIAAGARARVLADLAQEQLDEWGEES